MDMIFRILWIDDNVEDLDGGNRILQTRMRQHGFELNINYFSEINRESVEQLVKELKKNNIYDLIIADYDLGNAIGGVALLKKIRTSIHNTMVLYSATPVPQLRQAICTAGFDGVFCLARTELRTQLFPLIEVDLKKIKTPPFIRGLFVGAVSEIDKLLLDVCLALITGKESQVINEVKESHKKYLEEEVQAIDVRYSKPPVRVLKGLNFYQKKEILLPILESIGCHVSMSCADAINNFIEKINPIRIDLAHLSTYQSESGPQLQRKSGGDYPLNELTALLTEMMSIRSTLLNAHTHFTEINKNATTP